MFSYVVHVRIRKVGLLGHIGNIRFRFVLSVVGKIGVGCVIVRVAAHAAGGARRLQHDFHTWRAAGATGRGGGRHRATFISIIVIIWAPAVTVLKVGAGHRLPVAVVFETTAAEQVHVSVDHGAVNLGEAHGFWERRAVITRFYLRQDKIVCTDVLLVANVDCLDNLQHRK